MRLHEINNGFIQLEQISRKIQHMEEDGANQLLVDELKDQLAKEFNEADMLLEEKLDNVMYMLINKESEVEQLKKESARLAKKAKARENQIDYMKRTLIKEALTNTKEGKHKSLVGSLYPMNTQSVEIIDIDKIPDFYKESITTIKTNKKEIKKAHKEGETVPGVEIKNNTSIVFRK